jgi:hypothetical protein
MRCAAVVPAAVAGAEQDLPAAILPSRTGGVSATRAGCERRPGGVKVEDKSFDNVRERRLRSVAS